MSISSAASMDLPAAAPAVQEAHSKVVIKPGYHPRLTNEDLAPLKDQTWTRYNIFAFWMSDVHSVGGYITAGSLFALGLSSWQVLVALLVGIVIVQYFCNRVAKPSQVTGTPYPVICRSSFGVLGANIPAIIRGLIAVAWYGIQTYLASAAFMILALYFFPNLAPYADVAQHGFVGLSTLGWFAFMFMWVLQALVFWHGMEAIKHFIDWAGPGVYVVMALLCGYLVWKAGIANIDLNLGGVKFTGWDSVPVMMRRHRARGQLLQRPDAQLRRLLALRQDLRGGEEGQLLGPAGQLRVLLAADRGDDRGHAAGVRRTDHRPGGRRWASWTAAPPW